jgi:large conductance mechanosensitive channel
MKIIQEFKEFALKGNVIDLAVGLIIGAAFGAVVNSLVKDVMMPPLGYLTGGLDFSDKVITLREAVGSAGSPDYRPAVVMSYGLFINALITFFIQALAVFLVIKAMNSARRKKEAQVADEPKAPELTTQEQLLSEIRDLLKHGPTPSR